MYSVITSNKLSIFYNKFIYHTLFSQFNSTNEYPLKLAVLPIFFNPSFILLCNLSIYKSSGA